MMTSCPNCVILGLSDQDAIFTTRLLESSSQSFSPQRNWYGFIISSMVSSSTNFQVWNNAVKVDNSYTPYLSLDITNKTIINKCLFKYL